MVKNPELHNQWKNLWPSDLHYNKCHRKFFREKTVVVRRRQWHPTPVLLPGKSHGWGAWEAAVQGVAKSWTRLSDFTFTFQFHALEKEMATHLRVLAWRIPGTVGAWWATVYGVAQSWTRLKRLSSSNSSNGSKWELKSTQNISQKINM